MLSAFTLYIYFMLIKNKFGKLKNISTILHCQIKQKMLRINLHIESKQWFSTTAGYYTICGAFFTDL